MFLGIIFLIIYTNAYINEEIEYLTQGNIIINNLNNF